MESQQRDAPATVVETVRAACLDAALLAYEDAGIRGLCAEGRWEAAVAAIRQLDLSRVLEPRPSVVTGGASNRRNRSSQLIGK